MRFVTTRSVLIVGLASITVLAACRKEEEQPEAQYPAQQYQGGQQYPQQQYPQQQYPQQQYPQQQPGAYPTTAQPTEPAPSSIMPCQSEADPQCGLSRCVGGKCGSCTTADHCKAGATCMPTPLGGVCMPGGAPGAPTQ